MYCGRRSAALGEVFNQKYRANSLTQCQALLTNIEQKGNDDVWDPRFIEPLILEWASMPDEVKYTPKIIPIDVEFFRRLIPLSQVYQHLGPPPTPIGSARHPLYYILTNLGQ